MLASLAPAEFAPAGVFLNSATVGLAPQRSVTAMRLFEESRHAGTVDAAAVAAGARTAREVVERVYADVDRSLWPAAEWSVQSQLDYLRER